MSNLYVSFALMAVSGITYVAYKHPYLYEKEFFGKIFYTSTGLLICALAFDSGADSAYKELIPYLREPSSQSVKAALSLAKADGYVVLVSFLVCGYALFLGWLAQHMKNEIQTRRGRENKTEHFEKDEREEP